MINKVTLIGRLGGDPELRTLESGVSVARFSLATSDSYKDKDGNWQEVTEWHNINLWRDSAERAAKNLKKGVLCYIEGKLTYRKYTDREGVERMGVAIEATYFRRLEKTEGSPDAGFPTAEPAHTAARQEPAQEEANPVGFGDLPF